MFHLVSYLRDEDRVFETYWTNGRGVEAMGNTYTMLDLTRTAAKRPGRIPKPGGRNDGATTQQNPPIPHRRATNRTLATSPRRAP
jgi:hypothetical protein